MIAATNLLGAFQWDPGFRGILTVVLSVLVLYGSVALIVSTNSGPRLGTLIAVCALFAWMFVMGIVWAIYGIGWKGNAPSWKVVDVVQGPVSSSAVAKAKTLPIPGDKVLPDPVEVRNGDKDLLKEFPIDKKDPVLGDLLVADPDLESKIDAKLGDWKIFATSNHYVGELRSAATEGIGPDGEALFTDATQYAFLDTFFTGGETPRKDDSTISRIKFKVTHTFDKFHDPFVAAVQLQPVIPQTTKPGQAPPLPVIDKDAPIYTVILERDRGNLRQPAILFTIFNGIVFAITANMLHRRDKLATLQRAAVAAGAA